MQRVAHLLGRNLAQVFPLALAFEVAELDLVGFDGAVKSVKIEAGDLVAIDADFLAPVVEEADPVREGSDFCYFAGHKSQKPLHHRGHMRSQSSSISL